MKLFVFCFSIFLALTCTMQVSAATFQVNTGNSASIHELENYKFKSFREWKSGMVSSAETQLKQSNGAVALKKRISASTNDPNMAYKANSESGLSSNLQELQKQAEKDQYQLSITKDLTISDYFVGYLTKQRDMSAAINEVSGRLTPEEIAELMAAYANNFFSSRPHSNLAPTRAGSNQ